MNKNILLGFAALTLWPATTFGVGVAVSDIDWTASTIEVGFSAAPGTTPAFSCFGQSPIPPATATSNLAALGFADDDVDPDISNCFREAGDYTVTFTMVDNATNTVTSPTILNFTISASEVDQNRSTLVKQLGTDCYDTNAEPHLYANNSDSCDLDLTLLDRFGNSVNGVTAAELYSVTTADAYDATEGNKGSVNFRTGLRYNGNPIAYAAAGSTNISTISNGLKTISELTAIAPSIAMVGDYIARYQARNIDFGVRTPQINHDGSPSSSQVTDITKSVSLLYRHIADLIPTGNDFFWDEPGTLTTNLTTFGTGMPSSPRSGIVANRDSDMLFEESALPDSFSGSAMNFNGVSSVNSVTTVKPRTGFVVSSDLTLALSTELQYDLGGQTVQYPAGGTGLSASLNGGVNPQSTTNLIGYDGSLINLRIVGADIEGGVLGDETRMIQQGQTDDNTFQIGGVSATDLRQEITENTARLERGADNTQAAGAFSESWYNNSNVAIVNGGNVTISGPLPRGQNTLIIKNGNLIINGDVTYQNSQHDSFGFILLNDDTSDRVNGNIFVDDDVKRIAGTFYADGTFATNDNVDPTVANITNDPTGNTTQLLLTGTLFTKNTLGGAIIKNTSNRHYTPWGETDSQDEARKYDLHFIRRYRSDLDPNDGITDDNISACVGWNASDPDPNDCDSNDNAFIIRVDRKVSELTPPGFDVRTSFSR